MKIIRLPFAGHGSWVAASAPLGPPIAEYHQFTENDLLK